MVAAVIMPRLEVTKYEEEPSYTQFINDLIEGKFIGGFCIFGGTVESLPVILDKLQVLAKKSLDSSDAITYRRY